MVLDGAAPAVHVDGPGQGDERDGKLMSLTPALLGLMLSCASTAVLVRGPFAPEGIAGPVELVAAALISAVLMVAVVRTGRLPKRAVSLMSFLAVHVSGIASLVLGILAIAEVDAPPLLVSALAVLALAGTALLGFYWLRKLRGTSAGAVAFAAFGATGIASVVVLCLGLLGCAGPMASFVSSFLQFAQIRISRSLDHPSDAMPAVSQTYFGTSERRFSSTGYLVAAALGICCFSIPLGMGSALAPRLDGVAELVAHVLATLFTVVAALLIVLRISSAPGSSPTTGIWIALELMLAVGAVAISLDSPWPTVLGSSLVRSATYLFGGFVWYATVAFISFGKRDPYFYAAAGWIASTLLELVGRNVTSCATALAPGAPSLPMALMFLFMLIATQTVLTQLLRDHNRSAGASDAEAREAGAGAPQPGTGAGSDAVAADVAGQSVAGAMAIASESEAALSSATPDVHIATSVIEIGQRFGLTGREIEVLTLYALGHTQARVSEELQLSTNTVHTHIKRIYDKTDLHSRQEILDYIAQYGGR